jgi:putative oxidoreductase
MGSEPMSRPGSLPARRHAYVIPALGRIYERLDGVPWLLLRGIYGYFFIPHGAQKLFGWLGGGGLARTGEGFARIGLVPGWFWAGYIGCLEFFGGILMLIGLLTRPVAALFFGFMFVAAVYANQPNYFWLKGGILLPILFLVLALAILIRGGGKYSADRLLGREL